MPMHVLNWFFEFIIVFLTNIITCSTQIHSQAYRNQSLKSYCGVIGVSAVGSDSAAAGAGASATSKLCNFTGGRYAKTYTYCRHLVQ